MKKALLLLGCPESPSQTPLAIYAANKLDKMGFDVTLASTPSAMKLLPVLPDDYPHQPLLDVDDIDVLVGDDVLLIG